jgi:putative intracellular protease/amidase
MSQKEIVWTNTTHKQLPIHFSLNKRFLHPKMSSTALSKKVLIAVSDAHSFPLKKSDGSTVDQPTGYFLMELAKPLKKLLDAGYEVTFASPLGKEPQPDPLSTTLLAFAGNYYEQQRETLSKAK